MDGAIPPSQMNRDDCHGSIILHACTHPPTPILPTLPPFFFVVVPSAADGRARRKATGRARWNSPTSSGVESTRGLGAAGMCMCIYTWVCKCN